MFKKRRSNRKKIIFIGFILLIVGFTYGYFKDDMQFFNKPNINDSPRELHNSSETQVHKTGEEDLQKEQEPESNVSIANPNQIISDQIKLIWKTYYTKTRDTIINEGKLPTGFTGKSFYELEDYLKENYTDWEVRKFNQDFVELYRAIDGVSPNHFIVREKDGYIVVFQLDDKGHEMFFKQTDVSTDFLSDIDRKKLKEGIIVKGIDGVEQILEDYSS